MKNFSVFTEVTGLVGLLFVSVISKVYIMGIRVVALSVYLFGISQFVVASPEWIWIEDRKQSGKVSLQYGFEQDLKEMKSARLRMVGDFANVSLNFNGKFIGSAEAFGPVLELDGTGLLVDGYNKIKLLAKAVGTAPVVALQLEIVDVNDKERIVATSPQWKSTVPESTVCGYGDLGLEKWWGMAPLVIDEVDDYTQWKRAANANKATDPTTIQLLPGYEVELIRSANESEGSWVNIAFDPQGRITVAREDEGLIRYTLSNDYKNLIESEIINDDLKECRGLLYAHGSLYVNANNSKSLYRLRDTSGDGTFGDRKLLHASEGGVGHGRNDLTMGPDGKIYAINGDSVKLPESIVDRMSPTRKKFAPYQQNEGHVIRMDPDGNNKEIFCGGLRNPYGIDFNREGEAFTYDADAEYDMGTPWYRPTQIKHLTSGADFGWRAVTGNWPPYFPDHPDNTQAAVHIGKGSPTGVRFGTRSHFPQEYKRALYALDWAYGRIIAIHLVPRGSTYTGAAEVFLRGQPLNVTDLDFGPDGAMYFVTGGRKTKSGLYRVIYTGEDLPPRKLTSQERLRNRVALDYRNQRKRAESFHRKTKFDYLEGHSDPRIRQAWRIAGEHNPNELNFSKIGLKRDGKLTKGLPDLDKLTALMNTTEPEKMFSVMGLNNPKLEEGILYQFRNWDGMFLSEQLEFVDLIRRLMSRHELPIKAKKLILATLSPHFPNSSTMLNMALAPLLIELDPVSAVPQTVELLDVGCDQREGMHYLFHLRHAKAGWTLNSRIIFFRILATYETFLGGRGLPQALKNIRRESIATLTDEEKETLADVISRKPSLSIFPERSDRGTVKAWKIKDFDGQLNFNAKDRDFANGRKIFSVALCSRCHRHGREGYPIGPDLTKVARRFGRTELLREILLPNNTIAENYQTDILELSDGRQLSGQIIPNFDYRAPELQLAENPLYPDKITKIAKVNIIKRDQAKVSLMPPGLLNLFTKCEILDLIAWLENTD